MVAVMNASNVELTRSTLDTNDLHVERVVVHRVHARSPDKTIAPANYGVSLVNLPSEGRDALQKRIVSALGSRSHGVEMSIEGVAEGDFSQLAAHAIHLPDPEFIESTRLIADRLTRAQGTTSAPAGMLAVISGRIGVSPKRFIAVIKADIQDGFGSTGDHENIDLTYLQNLMLTPTQRFYKVGLLLELVSGLPQVVGEYDSGNFRAFLFDHLITARETRDAAAYFYQHFLGMDIQKSSKRLTKIFFEYTKSFVVSSSLSDEDKANLREALRVELRSESEIISTADFAARHIPAPLRDSYLSHMDAKGFPRHSVTKDVQFVKAQLKRPRKLEFVQGIKLLIPADVSDRVWSIESEPDATVVRISSGFTETE